MKKGYDDVKDMTILEIHSHSTISDGRFSPDEMAKMMSDAGVQLWALTDHDTMEGCDAARIAAKREEMCFVPGIEISAQVSERSIHVLGYGFDPDHTALREYGAKMVNARQQRMEEMTRRMCELGYEVRLEDVLRFSSEGNVGRPHMAQALVQRGYVDDVQGAFDRWLGRSRPGYVQMSWLSVEDAIALIVDAGGMVVLAHPARYGDIAPYLKRWRQAGLWGLEVRHPSHEISEEERLIRLADRFELGKTASNDWHGVHRQAMRRLGKVSFAAQWRDAFLAELMKTAYFDSDHS